MIIPTVSASTTYKRDEFKVYVGGETIGINIETGLKIVGLYEVEGRKPWEYASLKKGDIVIKIDNQNIEDAYHLRKLLEKVKDRKVSITYKRDGIVKKSHIRPIKTINDTYSLGIYVKDRVIGIGTLTYIVPNVNAFGALGHNLNIEVDNVEGSITDGKIISIEKARNGVPGEKKAKIGTKTFGFIDENSITGIHGTINNLNILTNRRLFKVASQEEVKLGKAYIYTNIEGNKVEIFEIKITDIDKQSKKDIKGIKFKITDKNLIRETGGIIKGMSGSPIIQNNKIIGAVTHVIVNKPTQGYGIHIDWMLQDSDIYILD